jgi:hypothetical protein
MTVSSLLFGVLLLAYGLFKLFVGYVSMVSKDPSAWVARFPWLRPFVSSDRTLAGQGLHAAMLLFGVYSILHGVAMLTGHEGLHELLHHRIKGIYVNAAVGAALLLFYGAVVYTSLPISQDQEHRAKYRREGLGTAVLFLMMVPIMLLHDVVVHGRGLRAAAPHLATLAAMVGVVAALGWVPSSTRHLLDAPLLLLNGWDAAY